MATKRFATCGLITAMVVSSLGVIGCVGSERQVSSTGAAGPDVDRPASVRPFARPPDAPPDGVGNLVRYYQEGGPPGCLDEEETEELSLSYGVGPLPREGRERFHPKPRIGDLLAVCVLGVLGEERVKIEFDAPGSMPPPSIAESGYRSPGEWGLVMGFLFLAPEYGSGRWRLTAHAGERTARRDLWVGRPTTPGYVHSETRGKRYVDFVVVGLEPNQEFSMHFYAPLETNLQAEYVSTARGRVGPEGITTITIDTVGATHDCHIGKLEVAGEIIDDMHNSLSHFCPWVETE